MKLTTFKPGARTTAHKPSRQLGQIVRPSHRSADDGGRRIVQGRTRQERNRRLLQRSPLCVHCLAEVEAGTRSIALGVDEWDHIIPLADGGADVESNLQGLCFAHHAAKSAREQSERSLRSRTDG